MAAKSQDPQFATFREAFCAYYRCRPEAFERKALWKGLYRHAVLLAIPIWLFNKRYFHKDLEVVRQFGNCRSSEEFTLVTGEFSTTNRLERSIRRGFMRIRVSGTRLVDIHNRLSRYVKPHEGSTISGFVVKAAAMDAAPTRPGDVPGARTDGSALVIRKLKQAHDEITAGRPIAETLKGLAFTEASITQALETNATVSPNFPWLRQHIQRERRLGELEEENARLLRKVASQSMEIDRLREGAEGRGHASPGVG